MQLGVHGEFTSSDESLYQDGRIQVHDGSGSIVGVYFVPSDFCRQSRKTFDEAYLSERSMSTLEFRSEDNSNINIHSADGEC
jgi:hypothetical protein